MATTDALAALLAPYRAALAGDEMNTMDPIYQLLAPPATPKERVADAAAGVAPSGDIQQYARRLAREMFGKGQWGALDQLVSAESSWNPKADNPSSTAFGLFQFLDDTWKSGYGGINSPTNDPYAQIRAGLDYVKSRYGSPSKAWSFHRNHNWY